MDNTQDPSASATPTPQAAADSGKGLAWERELIEKMLDSNLKEQRARRRWSIFFRFLAIAIVLIFFIMARSVDFSGTDGVPVGPHAAVIKINGIIQSDGKASAGNTIKALRKAFAEKNSIGVILRINSPGGSPVQAGQIHDEILRLREAHPDKPVHVVVDEICASGGYYVAVAANNIYVDKASIVGSIGVMINGFGFTGLMDKMGIERRLMTSGKNKGFMDPFSPQSEKQKQYAQNLIDEVHEQFITVVKNGRGERLKTNDDTFSGMIWTGAKSVELGLADDFGTVSSVAQNVFHTKTLIDYTEEEKLSDRVLKKLGASAGEAAAKYAAEEVAPSLK